METDIKGIEPLPQFLVDSRSLRNDAVELAQLVRLAVREEAHIGVFWKPISTLITDTNTAFNSTYNGDTRKHLIESLELYQAETDCENGLKGMRQAVAGVSDTAPDADKYRAVRSVEANLDTLTRGAQSAELQIAVASHKLVTDYSQLAAALKEKTQAAKATAEPPGVLRYPVESERNNSVFIRAAYLAQAAPQSSAESRTRSRRPTEEKEPQFLHRLREEVARPVELPSWTSQLIETTPREGEYSFLFFLTSLIGSVGGGLVVGATGVSILLRHKIMNTDLPAKSRDTLLSIRPLSYFR